MNVSFQSDRIVLVDDYKTSVTFQNEDELRLETSCRLRVQVPPWLFPRLHGLMVEATNF